MSDWKYDVDEVGDDADDPADHRETLEPGSPSAENVLFVVLGALTTLFVLYQMATVV